MTELRALRNHLVDLQLRDDPAQNCVAWALARIEELQAAWHPSMFGHDRTVFEEMLDNLRASRG